MEVKTVFTDVSLRKQSLSQIRPGKVAATPASALYASARTVQVVQAYDAPASPHTMPGGMNK